MKYRRCCSACWSGLDSADHTTESKKEPILLCIHDAHTTPHTQTHTHGQIPLINGEHTIPYPGGLLPPRPTGGGPSPPPRPLVQRTWSQTPFPTYVDDFRGSKILENNPWSGQLLGSPSTLPESEGPYSHTTIVMNPGPPWAAPVPAPGRAGPAPRRSAPPSWWSVRWCGGWRVGKISTFPK